MLRKRCDHEIIDSWPIREEKAGRSLLRTAVDCHIDNILALWDDKLGMFPVMCVALVIPPISLQIAVFADGYVNRCSLVRGDILGQADILKRWFSKLNDFALRVELELQRFRVSSPANAKIAVVETLTISGKEPNCSPASKSCVRLKKRQVDLATEYGEASARNISDSHVWKADTGFPPVMVVDCAIVHLYHKARTAEALIAQGDKSTNKRKEQLK